MKTFKQYINEDADKDKRAKAFSSILNLRRQNREETKDADKNGERKTQDDKRKYQKAFQRAGILKN